MNRVTEERKEKQRCVVTIVTGRFLWSGWERGGGREFLGFIVVLQQVSL